MEHITYERPREKLRYRGVGSLSNVELLQILIGSGSKGFPVARIARKVQEVIEASQKSIDVDTLQTIDGLGEATASRIIAAITLGQRLSRSSPIGGPSINTTQLKTAKHRSILYTTITGEGKVVATYFEALKSSENTTLIAKRICAQALADEANGIAVAIGYKHQNLQSDTSIMGFVNDLKEMTQLLQLRLYSIELTNSQQSAILYSGLV